MDDKKYKGAMKNLKTSSDFNERTINMLSNKKIKKEKYIKGNNRRYIYGALVACLLLVFFIPSIFNNSDIELQDSTGNISIKYISKVPNIKTSNNLILLTEEEIFSEFKTSILKGEVVDIKNINIDMGKNHEFSRSIVSVKILESYRGNETLGDIITILVPTPIDTGIWVEDTEVISSIRVGDKGIFMPLKYEDHILGANNSTLYLREVSEYGLLDGERYAFIEKDNKVIYSNWAYESLKEVKSLEDIEEYILKMIE